MGGLPDMLFVIDTIKDSIAISEAKTLNIPVVAVLDSNANPDGIDYPIPGNDDALRAVSLYCNLVSESILDGLQAEMLKHGKEIDQVEKLPEQDVNSEDGKTLSNLEDNNFEKKLPQIKTNNKNKQEETVIKKEVIKENIKDTQEKPSKEIIASKAKPDIKEATVKKNKDV